MFEIQNGAVSIGTDHGIPVFIIIVHACQLVIPSNHSLLDRKSGNRIDDRLPIRAKVGSFRPVLTVQVGVFHPGIPGRRVIIQRSVSQRVLRLQ